MSNYTLMLSNMCIVCAGAAQVRDFLNAKDARKYGRGYIRCVNYQFSQILGTKKSKVA